MNDRKQKKSRFNTPAQGLMRIGLTILFIWVINKNLTAGDMEYLCGKITIIPLTAALILGLVSFWVQVLRWKAVLQFQGFPTGHGAALKTMLWGSLLAFVTPGRVGELVRGLDLNPQRKGDSVIAVMIDRFFAIAITAFAGLLCMGLQLLFFNLYPLPRLSILALIALVFLGILYWLLKYSDRFVKPTSKLFRYLNHLQKLVPALLSIPGERIIVYSFVSHLLLLIQTATLLNMFGSNHFGANIVAAGQSYAYMLFLPFFVANAGLREHAFRLFLERLDPILNLHFQAYAIALGTAALVLIINIVIPAIGGLVWAFIDYRKRIQTRNKETIEETVII